MIYKYQYRNIKYEKARQNGPQRGYNSMETDNKDNVMKKILDKKKFKKRIFYLFFFTMLKVKPFFFY